MQAYVNITYDLNANKCSFQTNLKQERIKEILGNFLRLQIGAGEDHSPSAELEEYHVNITLNLIDDTFYSTNDCGNLGLRDGIVMLAVRQLSE